MLSLILYAVIQIIIEMVPVSSSGHVLLIHHFLAWSGWQTLPLEEWFDHFLHGPTLVILMIYFAKDWMGILQHSMCGILRPTASWWRMVRVVSKMVLYISLADGVTAVMYLTLKRWLESTGLALHPYVVMAGMAMTMLLLLSTYLLRKNGDSVLTASKAMLLGLVQGCAFLPGLSRFGSTYVIARWLGIGHRRAFQFSFAMFVPLIIVAFGGHGIPGMVHHWPVAATVFIPCVCAAVLAYYVFGLVERLAISGRWYYLGWYMAIPISFLLLSY